MSATEILLHDESDAKNQVFVLVSLLSSLVHFTHNMKELKLSF